MPNLISIFKCLKEWNRNISPNFVNPAGSSLPYFCSPHVSSSLLLCAFMFKPLYVYLPTCYLPVSYQYITEVSSVCIWISIKHCLEKLQHTELVTWVLFILLLQLLGDLSLGMTAIQFCNLICWNTQTNTQFSHCFFFLWYIKDKILLNLHSGTDHQGFYV